MIGEIGSHRTLSFAGLRRSGRWVEFTERRKKAPYSADPLALRENEAIRKLRARVGDAAERRVF
jgi:hypothetical protein